MMTRPARARRLAPTAPTRHALALALIAGALLAGACGNDTPTASAIRSASDRLNLLTAGGGSFPNDLAKREEGLQKVLTEVRAAGNAGTPAQQAALSLLAARASNALGDIKAEAAAQAEARALNQVQFMRTLVRAYVAQSASAAAAEQFNPAEAISAFTAQLAERQAQLQKDTADLEAMKAEVARLNAQSEGLEAQASAKRNEASSIRGQAQGQSQVAQLAAAERAAAVSREASTLSAQASLIAADVSARQPLVTAQQAKADARAEEVKRLRAAVEELGTRQTVARELADTARKDAAASAADFKTRLAEMEQTRARDMAPAAEAALASFSAALAAARGAPTDAGNDDKAALKVSMAMAQQGRADTLLIRARGVGELAAVLGAAKDAKPDMPGKADIDAAHAKYAAEVTTLLTEARAAFGEAAAGFESLGGAKGKMVAERADYVARTLKWLEAGDLSAPKPDFTAPASAPAAAAPDAPTGASASGGATASTGGPEDAVRASVMNMIAALKSGDTATAADLFIIDNDQDREMLGVMVSLTGGMTRLDAACRSKLNASLDEIMGRRGGPGIAQRLNVQPDQIKITIKSDTEAEAVMPGDTGEPAKARLIDGKWKFAIGESDRAMAADPVRGLQAAKAMASVFGALAGDVESGKITTKEQLMGAMAQRMMALQGQAGGGPGGG